MNVTRHCLPADHLVSRDVPTLIYDSAAWIKAEHYDNAKADNERLSHKLAGAVEALRKYGGCLENCSALSGAPECSCGFDEALLHALGRSGGSSDGS
jgi:hypothetical protein